MMDDFLKNIESGNFDFSINPSKFLPELLYLLQYNKQANLMLLQRIHEIQLSVKGDVSDVEDKLDQMFSLDQSTIHEQTSEKVYDLFARLSSKE